MQAYIANIAASDALVETRAFADARRQLSGTRHTQRGWEHRHLFFRSDRSSAAYPTQGTPVRVTFAGDDTRVLFGDRDGSVALWDIAVSTITPVAGDRSAVGGLGFDAENERVVVGDRDGHLTVHGLSSGSTSDSPWPVHDEGVLSLVLEPGNDHALSVSDEGAVLRWPLADPSRPETIDFGGSRVRELAVSPNGRIAGLTPDSRVVVHDSDGRIRRSARLTWDALHGIAIAESAGIIAVGDHQGFVHFLKIDSLERTGGFLAVSRPGGDQVLAVATDSDGDQVAVGTSEGLIFVYGGFGGTEPTQRVFPGHDDAVTDLAFSDSDAWLVSSSDDSTVRVWSLRESDQPVIGLDHQHEDVWAAFARHDDPVVFTGDTRGVLWRWDLESGLHESASAAGSASRIDGIDVSDDGASLAAVHEDGTVRLWSTSPLRLEREILGGGGPRFTIALFDEARDRLLLATGSSLLEPTHTLYVLDLSTPDAAPVSVLDEIHPVNGLVLSPSGSQLFIGLGGAPARLVDADSFETIAELPEVASSAAAFHPEDPLLVTSWSDGGIALWNSPKIATEPMRVLQAHTEAVRSLAFDDAGMRMLSSSNDGIGRVWHTNAWEVLMTLRPPPTKLGVPANDVVFFTGFVNKGNDVITASVTPNTVVWRSEPGRLPANTSKP